MSILDTYELIKSDITNAYTSLENKGATLPEKKNLENLSGTIESIETGGGGGGTDLMQWKCDNVKSLEREFANYTGTELPDLSNLDTSKVENFQYMFYKNSNLTESPMLDTSNGTHFNYMYSDCSNLIKYPQLNTSKAQQLNYMFYKCSGLTESPQYDTSNVGTFSGMFAYCTGLTESPMLDTSNGAHFDTMYSNCSNLITVNEMNFIKLMGCNNIFLNCTNLTNLNLKNIYPHATPFTLTIGSGTTYGHLLTVDSLVNTIKELWDFSSGTKTYKLNMGTTNTAKLTDVYVKLITPTAEQIATDPNIESKMPCEVCESTDEGAMLIMDYATLKKWSIS